MNAPHPIYGPIFEFGCMKEYGNTEKKKKKYYKKGASRLICCYDY
jgi:hypothetical protein